MRSTAAGVLVALLAVCGCAGSGPDDRSEPSPSPSADPCPDQYAEPDPDRPRTTLTFDVSDDLSVVRGTEEVTFTPDLAVSELVFRLTANSPTATEQGTSIRVEHADAGGGDFRFERAGAGTGTRGGLLIVPLADRVDPGTEVTARIEYTLTLGSGGFERFGHGHGIAWWGSGQPLLAWERGVGWHREPLIDFTGESATSEAANVDLTVTAPPDATVVASGGAESDGNGSWHATAPTARDVSVTVGAFATAARDAEGVHLTAAVPGSGDAGHLLDQVAEAVSELTERFGPFPFDSLGVSLIPFEGGGIEYPGSILLLGQAEVIVVHEVAHQWFYGMVGDSQSRDPWLDEAFATYATDLVLGSAEPAAALDRPGRVGASMTDFENGTAGNYFGVVYQKGGAALMAARAAAGADAFDADITCYVNANAWRIAAPADLASALSDLPKATDILTAAGAL